MTDDPNAKNGRVEARITRHQAEEKLARMIEKDFENTVSGWKIGQFIREHWATIAPLAHIIHDAPDVTKEATIKGQPVDMTEYPR